MENNNTQYWNKQALKEAFVCLGADGRSPEEIDRLFEEFISNQAQPIMAQPGETVYRKIRNSRSFAISTHENMDEFRYEPVHLPAQKLDEEKILNALRFVWRTLNWMNTHTTIWEAGVQHRLDEMTNKVNEALNEFTIK